MADLASILSICPSCGTKNRVPVDHLTDTGRCGKCKATLPPVSEPIAADDALFDGIISESKVPVFVDFWAPWCGPCRMAAPEVEKLARETGGQAVVLKVNTDAHPQLGVRFGVQSIPNFVIFQGGQPVFQRAGLASGAEMRRWLDHAAGSRR